MLFHIAARAGASLLEMRLKLGSVAFLTAAGSGYGIGVTEDGHRVEFLDDWQTLARLQPALANADQVYVDVGP